MRRKHRFLAYVCAGVAVLAVFALAEAWLLHHWHQTIESQLKRSALKEELLRLRQLASDVDNGFRGYVLMRRTIYLTPMVAAQQEIPQALERLTRLCQEPPSLHGRAQVLKRRLDELLETKRALAAKVENGEHENVLAYVRSGDGVALSQTLSAAFADLEDKIERQYPAHDVLLSTFEKKTLWQLVAAQGGTVLLGVLIVEMFLTLFSDPQRTEP